MIVVRSLDLAEVKEIIPARHGDKRGFLSEVWNRSALAAEGIEVDFVQDNHSFSAQAGVLRGLHYQEPPFAQAKLVRVIRGAIFDIAVDIRNGSPTFGKWVGLTIAASAWNQILVPEGFAHGFLTLEPGTEVLYKASRPYSPSHDRAIRFDDPAIGIEWPATGAAPILSDKDRTAPMLAEASPGFTFRAT